MLAKNYRNVARNALRGRWGVAFGTGLVATILGANSIFGNENKGGMRSINNAFDNGAVNAINVNLYLMMLYFILIWWFITLILGSSVKLGHVRFNKNLILNQSPQFSDLFSRFHMFGKALLLRLLMLIKILAWSLLFIIPGIIAVYRYAMAPYILEENPGMSVGNAIKHSKQMMVGNKWKLFCLQISFIGWVLLSICTCGIGILWVRPYYYAAEAAFFFEVSVGLWTRQQGNQNQNQFQ